MTTSRGYPQTGYSRRAVIFVVYDDFQKSAPKRPRLPELPFQNRPVTSPQYNHELMRELGRENFAPKADRVLIGAGARALGLLATRANPVLTAFQLGYELGNQAFDFYQKFNSPPDGWVRVGDPQSGYTLGYDWVYGTTVTTQTGYSLFNGTQDPADNPASFGWYNYISQAHWDASEYMNPGVSHNFVAVGQFVAEPDGPSYHVNFYPETTFGYAATVPDPDFGWMYGFKPVEAAAMPVERVEPPWAAREAGPVASPARPSELLAVNPGTAYVQEAGGPVVAYKPGSSGHQEVTPPRPRRPGRNTKEKKLVLGRAGSVLRIFGHYTEGIDLIQALFDAIDWKKRQKDKVVGKIWGDGFETKYPGQKYWSVGAWRQARYVFTNFGAIDFESALRNIVGNEIEDRVIGKAGQLANQITKNKHWISPKGIGMGPTL